ncbi:hypothetical protein BJ138DRAFT_1122892 [Hygrophoropsis aurantiaca]|uniref:Uncharacterized protein n=1 Tax=Hygrophoropsis aurantiaca TaxID=72124 RepID=A0ACB8APN5_9AGAM|nr:hypothetical protein BJ138DRAFT_1122892 [Hygrophoropsis aurantiaca]
MDSVLSLSNVDRPITGISISAISFLFWEYCITFNDEVEYIWSKPWKAPIKWLFLLTRYVGLGAVIGNRFTGIGGNNPTISCTGFLIFQVTMSEFLVSFVELILMIRVHALYNRDNRMAILLAFVFVAGVVVAAIGLSSTVPNSHFNEICAVVRIETSLAYFSFSTVMVEGILLVLTVVKCFRTFRETRHSIPIITLMLRDGTMCFLAIMTTLIPTSLFLVVKHGAFVSFMTPWFLAVLSCAGCRLIINMQHLSPHDCLPQTAHQTFAMITSQILIEGTTCDLSDVD